MRDPLTWSIPLGRWFGIAVRVHLLFLVFAIVIVARGANYGYGGEALILLGLIFTSVLLHEFGHCFGARLVEGDASDILLWPLGGLASVDVPNTPRAHFITVICGPAVNLMLCGLTAGALVIYKCLPPFSPFWYPYTSLDHVLSPQGPPGVVLMTWVKGALQPDSVSAMAPILLAQLFYVNWLQFWFNVLLMGFPMDGGRMLQCVLWARLGFRPATQFVIFTGYLTAFVIMAYAAITAGDMNAFSSMMLLFLGLFIYDTCRQHSILLETGGLVEDSPLGYDFSQGYTSLERGEGPRRRRTSFWQRWWQRRTARKRLREEQQRQAEERRLDELLAKVQRDGAPALTDEERRFLDRVSAKFRNRNRS